MMNTSPLTYVSAGALTATAFPPRPFLLEPLLTAGSAGLIYGPAGVGKSFLAGPAATNASTSTNRWRRGGRRSDAAGKDDDVPRGSFSPRPRQIMSPSFLTQWSSVCSAVDPRARASGPGLGAATTSAPHCAHTRALTFRMLESSAHPPSCHVASPKVGKNQ